MADKQYQIDSTAWLSLASGQQEQTGKIVPLIRGNSVATLNQIYQHQNSIPVRSRILNTAKSLQQSSIEQSELEGGIDLAASHLQPARSILSGPQLQTSCSPAAERARSALANATQSSPPLSSSGTPAPLVQVINVGRRHRKNGSSALGRQVQMQAGQPVRPLSDGRAPRSSWAWSSDSSSCSSSHGVSPIRNQSPIHPVQTINQLSSSSSSSQSQLASSRRSPKTAAGSSAVLEVRLQHSRSPSPSRSTLSNLSASQVASLSPRQRRLLPDIGLGAQTSLMQASPAELGPAAARYQMQCSSQSFSTSANPQAMARQTIQEDAATVRPHHRQRKLPQVPLTAPSSSVQLGSQTAQNVLPQRQAKLASEKVISAVARKNKSLSSSSSASSNSFSAGPSIQQLVPSPTNNRPLLAQANQQLRTNQQLRVQSFPMQSSNQPPSVPAKRLAHAEEAQAASSQFSSSCSNSLETPSPRSPLFRQLAGSSQAPAVLAGRNRPVTMGSSSSSSGSASTPATANRSPPGPVMNAVQGMASSYRSYFTFDHMPPTCPLQCPSKLSAPTGDPSLGQNEEQTRATVATPNHPATGTGVESGAVRGRRLSTCGSGLRANFLMNKQHAISEFTPPRSLESSTSRSSTDWLPVGTASGELQLPSSPHSSAPVSLQIRAQTSGGLFAGRADNCASSAPMNQLLVSSSSSSIAPNSAQAMSNQFCLRTDLAPYLSVSHQLLNQRRQSGAGPALGLPPRAASATETSTNLDGQQQQSGLTNIKLNPMALVGVRASFSQATERDGEPAAGRLAPSLGITNALSIDVYQGSEHQSPQHQSQQASQQLAAPNQNPALGQQRQSLVLPARDRQPSNVSTVSMPAGHLAAATGDSTSDLLLASTGCGEQARRRFGAWAERIGGSPEAQRRTCSAGRRPNQSERRAYVSSSDSYSNTDNTNNGSDRDTHDSGSTGSANSVSSASRASSPLAGRASASDQLTLDDRLRLAERSANELFRKVEVGRPARWPGKASPISAQRQPDYPQLLGETYAAQNKESSGSRGGRVGRKSADNRSSGESKSNIGKGDPVDTQLSALILAGIVDSNDRAGHGTLADEQVKLTQRPANRTRRTHEHEHNDLEEDNDDGELSDDEQGDDLSLFLRSVDKQRLRQLKSAQRVGRSGSPSNNIDIDDHQSKHRLAGATTNGANKLGSSAARGRVAVRALKRAVTLRALVKTFGRRASSCDSPGVLTHYLAATTSARDQAHAERPGLDVPRSAESLLLVPPEAAGPGRRAASALAAAASSSSVRRRAAQLFRRAKSSIGQKSGSSELATEGSERTASSQLELACQSRMATATDCAINQQLKRTNKLASAGADPKLEPTGQEPPGEPIAERVKGLARMRSGK